MNFTIETPDARRLARFSGILFLDCDGVMNTVEWCRERAVGLRPDEYFTEFAPHTVAPLNRILAACNLGIVVTSAWRLDERNDLPAILERNGVERARERYLGRTPDLSSPGNSKVVFGHQRGDEILEWMIAVNFIAPFVVLNDASDFDAVNFIGPFVVLDDASDFDAVAEDHFKTDVRFGLTEEIADAIIVKLTHEQEMEAERKKVQTKVQEEVAQGVAKIRELIAKMGITEDEFLNRMSLYKGSLERSDPPPDWRPEDESTGS